MAARKSLRQPRDNQRLRTNEAFDRSLDKALERRFDETQHQAQDSPNAADAAPNAQPAGSTKNNDPSQPIATGGGSQALNDGTDGGDEPSDARVVDEAPVLQPSGLLFAAPPVPVPAPVQVPEESPTQRPALVAAAPAPARPSSPTFQTPAITSLTGAPSSPVANAPMSVIADSALLPRGEQNPVGSDNAETNDDEKSGDDALTGQRGSATPTAPRGQGSDSDNEGTDTDRWNQRNTARLDELFTPRIRSTIEPAVARAEQINQSIADQRATEASGRKPAASAVGATKGDSSSGDDRTMAPPIPQMPRVDGDAKIVAGLSAKSSAMPTSEVDEGAASKQLLGRGLAALVGQKGGTMAIRLDPPSLGDVRITMTITAGRVTAELVASNPHTQAMLNADLAQLRSALESQGLTVDRLSVQTGRQEAMPATGSRNDSNAAAPQHAQTPHGAGNGNDDRNENAQGRSSRDRSDGGQDAGRGQSRGRSDDDTQRERRGSRDAERRRTFATVFATGPDATSAP